MGLRTYLKRGIKYVLKEHNPPVVKTEIFQKTPSNMMKDKVVMITGGGSGLGYYIAKKLSEEGAIIIITGRNEEKLKKASKEINDKAIYFCWDVSDINKGKEIIDEIYEKYGKIDVLINNAGISLHEGNILKVTEKNFDNQISTNLKGSYFLSQNYISDMTGIKKEENLYAENAAGRFFIPEEVAEVVLFLVSEYSKSISGEIIHCNAGNHLQLGYK